MSLETKELYVPGCRLSSSCQYSIYYHYNVYDECEKFKVIKQCEVVTTEHCENEDRYAHTLFSYEYDACVI